MNPTDFTLPVHYLRHIADQVRRRGVDVDRWLAQSELTPAKLRDPTVFLDFRTFERLATGALRPDGGAGAGGSSWGSASSPIATGSSATPPPPAPRSGDAVTLFEQFAPLRTSMVSLTQTRTADDVRIRVQETRPLGEVKRPVLEAIVMSVKRILDAVSAGSAPAREVAFAFPPPPYASLARDMFGCSVTWEQSWDRPRLRPVGHGTFRCRWPIPKRSRQTRSICQRELEKLTADERMTTRVRRLLLEAQSELPSLTVAARLVRMTPRTLHRRLLEEGHVPSARCSKRRGARSPWSTSRRDGSASRRIAYTLGYSRPRQLPPRLQALGVGVAFDVPREKHARESSGTVTSPGIATFAPVGGAPSGSTFAAESATRERRLNPQISTLDPPWSASP